MISKLGFDVQTAIYSEHFGIKTMTIGTGVKPGQH